MYTIFPLNNKTMIILAIIIGMFAAYVFGAFSYSRGLWPIELLLELKKSTIPRLQGKYDEFGRLVEYPNKQPVPCLKQTTDTAVLLVMGQSNSANHAQKKFTTQYPGKVVNYFNGRCFAAASPLLGASGEGGEFITPLADQLIENGSYRQVIIIASGIGNTGVFRWQRDGDLNDMLLQVIRPLQNDYAITHVIWHQGEFDYVYRTSAKNYQQSFHSLVQTLRENAVDAPILISIASQCGPNADWREVNPTTEGQRQLIDHQNIFLGVDTDTLLSSADRQTDGCHWAESGQLKVADALATAIKNLR